ncbi:MAG: DUF3667 domain-containing protein [Gemmatimonadales bacterium]|nr:DUF3667 domain-containing protein [Gemmatimonadales bacterium]MYG48863.1 DUF3667 domain-containing protein [Gemmatimonadales bacterium]MYK03108.1 DUF3667 domain-containing protein [Candidatus Palauibacter ramosifaciens]
MTPAGARACPNCGRDRPESFCAHCGQSDRDYARALRSVAGEFLRETFEVDSRLFRTLKLLMFRPGSLTREFSRNRRAGFVSPVRLYIFASFVFFLLLSLMADFGEAYVFRTTDEDVATSSTGEDRADEAEPTDAAAEPPTEEQLAAFRVALPPEQRRKADDILARPEGNVGRQILLSVAREGGVAETAWVGRFLLLSGIDMLHDPSVIPRRLIANMPIAMFFLLPVLGLILAAFHLRKKRFYVEHLVFAIHIQTFAFLIYSVALLLPDSGPGGWVGAGCTIVPYPYFVVAFRRYYEDGWVRTVAKSVGVYVLYTMALIPAFVVSVFVTG